MATILPFPVKKVVPIWGLTEEERDAVQAEGYDLMLQGHATGVSIHNDGQYMCVFDGNGEPYAIGREAGVCYLYDPDETMLAHSRRFENVLQALEILLTSRPDGAA
ncbi:MAG: hypothetical protein O3A51_07010 [Verrucomicrobia bacterium]|nr:hypothetical protein [Verrucomicrobiota bacterium]